MCVCVCVDAEWRQRWLGGSAGGAQVIVMAAARAAAADARLRLLEQQQQVHHPALRPAVASSLPATTRAAHLLGVFGGGGVEVGWLRHWRIRHDRPHRRRPRPPTLTQPLLCTSFHHPEDDRSRRSHLGVSCCPGRACGEASATDEDGVCADGGPVQLAEEAAARRAHSAERRRSAAAARIS